MAVQIMQNVPLFVGAFDLTGDTNELSVGDVQYETKEKTNFASAGWTESVIGLGTAKLNTKSFHNAGATSGAEYGLNSLLGTAGVPVSAIAGSVVGGAAGDRATFAKCLVDKYDWGGKVGDIAMVNGEYVASGPDPIVDGWCALPSTALTATGTGSVVTGLAVGSTQKVYCALHIFGVTGTATPTVTMKLQSAALIGFGSPTDRITFTAATAVGYQFANLAGPITDTFWRVAYTISGTTPSLQCAVVFGIR